MTQPFDVIGYEANLNLYCPRCAKELFDYNELTKELMVDVGVSAYPIFADSEWDFPFVCESCGDYIDARLTHDGINYALEMVRDALYKDQVTEFMINVCETLSRYLPDNYVLGEYQVLIKNTLGVDNQRHIVLGS